MKLALLFLSLASLGVISCERHKFEDVKVLHESHGADHGDHGAHADEHGAHADEHGEKKAEH
jgi:hypothetical protein